MKRIPASVIEGLDSCSFADCGRPIFSGGLCTAHYNQRRRGETLRPARTARGHGGMVQFRMPLERIAEVAVQAEAEGIEPSEWYRRAVEERLTRKARR